MYRRPFMAIHDGFVIEKIAEKTVEAELECDRTREAERHIKRLL